MGAPPPRVTVTYSTLQQPSASDTLELTEDMRVPPPPRWGWEQVANPVFEGQLHLVPTWDVGMHSFQPGCPCGAHPDSEAGVMLIHHHAFDGREAYEQGARKHH